MKKLDALKDEVFRNLSKSPKIEAFFKDSLEERIKLDDNWIENALVHNILEGITANHPLMELIEALCEDKENFEILKNKLNPKDDYDIKMHDVLAELNGYYHLKKSGFEEIEALGEGGQKKKPDFSAIVHNQHYLFEVKNIRSPIDLSNELWDKYYARKFINPGIYSNAFIEFEASTNWRDIRFNPKEPNDLYEKTISWLNQTFQMIESTNVDLIELTPFEDVFEKETLKIRCVLKRRKSLGMIFGFNRAICISDPLRRKNSLYPFAKKVLEKVGDALEQLLEFDKSDTCKKYVLINWQKTPELAHFYENECISIVRNVDGLVKNISENLFAKLLNIDSLP
jgi:hypothetical protein